MTAVPNPHEDWLIGRIDAQRRREQPVNAAATMDRAAPEAPASGVRSIAAALVHPGPTSGLRRIVVDTSRFNFRRPASRRGR